VRVERRDAVEVWTLDRPQVRNALDAATFQDLARAIEHAATDEALRCVVLTADGDTFAAGGDLRELRGASCEADAERLADLGLRVCSGLGRLAVPVIAALPGAAIGGGAELAIACDLRVASPRASLCFKHAHMGVTTAWGVLPRLVGLAGRGAASRLLLMAQTIEAPEALRLGLFDAVSSDAPGACLELAECWVGDVVRGAPLAVAGMKALLREATRGDAVLQLERDRFVATWTSADHADAVEAFFERRPPRWTGR
jgi:enoyl-CoA hydratase/carnithine racemase